MHALSRNVVFVPVYNEARSPFWTTVSGGSAVRSGLSPSGYFWNATTAGHFVENRFVGDVCRIYFGSGSTGTVNITLDGNTLMSGLTVSSLPRYGNYFVLKISNLTYDTHVIRITVASAPIHVIGMLAVQENLPFFNFTSIHNATLVNYLSRSVILASTTSTLGANATYNSGWIDLESDGNINRILITVFSNVGGTLHIEFSNDSTNADAVQTISYTGNTTPYIAPIQRVARYLRIRYVNGSTAQSTFRLYVRGVYTAL
jgi:hypothetical protein